MDTDRLEAFSDGVIAIAITLLLLEISVPEAGSALGPALVGLWPSYVAYAVSFLVIGAIWINHHAMFRHIVRADGTLLLLNVLHLMLIAFLPFPTGVLARAFSRGAGEAVAAALYGGTLTVLGILANAMWRDSARGHRLLDADLAPAEARRIGRRLLVGPIVYAVATMVALVAPWLALALYLLLNVYYLRPRKGVHREVAARASS
jgi:TMEM175 potassium channel family protein